MNDLYDAIRGRFGLAVPNDYREFVRRGFVEISGAGYRSDFTTPGFSYLWVSEMEWYSPDKIATIELPEYCIDGFVPFAHTGGGDYWCWYHDGSNRVSTQVLHCPHDYSDAEVFAPSLTAAVYRSILCGASDIRADEERSARMMFERYARDLAFTFPAAWTLQMQRLVDANLKTWQFRDTPLTGTGFLTPEEVEVMVRADGAFGTCGQKIRWMRPLP